MTIKGWPFGNDQAAQVVTDVEWAKMFTLLRSDGVSGMAVSRTSGLGLQVAAGRAFVGGNAIEITGTETVTVGAANPSNPRIDLIVLRRTLTSGSTLGDVEVAVLAGTPASSPVAPSVTQNVATVWETALCQVYVPAGASALVDGNLTDVRPAVGVASTEISDATSLGRSVLTAADRAAVLTALGLSAPVKALLNATTAIQMREALRIFKAGASFTPTTDDLRYTDV